MSLFADVKVCGPGAGVKAKPGVTVCDTIHGCVFTSKLYLISEFINSEQL